MKVAFDGQRGPPKGAVLQRGRSYVFLLMLPLVLIAELHRALRFSNTLLQ